MRRAVSLATIALVVASLVATPAIAAAYNADAGPSLSVTGEVTIDDYAASDGGELTYENNNGERVALDASVNSSNDAADLGTGYVNPYEFTATDVMDSQFGQFPRVDAEDGNAASALDASEWSAGGASVSDTSTAPNVDAVSVSLGSSTDSATYSNFSIESDAQKRYLAAAFDLSTNGASQVSLEIHDATDGDVTTVNLYDADADASSDSVASNTTGEGKLIQTRIGGLSASGGDGRLQEIGKIVVTADGGATVDFSMIDLERTDKLSFGTRTVSDGDDELTTETIYESDGPISASDLDMGEWASDAKIKGLTVPVEFPAGQAEAQIEFEEPSNPAYDSLADVYIGFEIPDQFDLSYANLELSLNQTEFDESRYTTAEYAEGAGDGEFSELDDSSFSSFAGQLGTTGTEIALDDTIQPGDRNVVHLRIGVTADERTALESSGGAFGPSGDGGGGGIVDMILSPFGALAALVAGGFARVRGLI